MSLIFLPIYIHTCNEEEELLVLSVSAGDRIIMLVHLNVRMNIFYFLLKNKRWVEYEKVNEIISFFGENETNIDVNED